MLRDCTSQRVQSHRTRASHGQHPLRLPGVRRSRFRFPRRVSRVDAQNVPGTQLATQKGMARHWITSLVFAVLTVMAIALGVVRSPLVGVVVFMLSVGVWYVVSIVGMRPKGYEEHDDPKAPKPRNQE